MSTSAQLIRGERLAARLSQVELSSRSGIRQPNVARAESDQRSSSFDTCERLVRAAGFRLAVLPGGGTDAFATGVAVRAAIEDGREERAYRLVIQLADDLAQVHGAERVAATVASPPSSGDVRYDAFLAGVVEVRLDAEHLPQPSWLEHAPVLQEPWYVDSWAEGDGRVTAATPPALRRRGVHIDAAELVSV